MHCLAEHSPKPAKHQFTKLCRMTSAAIREGAKINLKMPNLIRKQALSKNQKSLSNREKLQKCLKDVSGYSVWQSTPQNRLKINLLNFVG